MSRFANVAIWSGSSAVGALVAVGFALWMRNFGDPWIGFAGSILGGLMTLLAAGVAWRVTKPTADLARVQMLLAERDVLLSTKREYDAEHLTVDECLTSLDVIISQIRLAPEVFGLQSSLAWIVEAEGKLSTFRGRASPIFSHAIVWRARLDTGDDAKSREETLDAVRTLEAELLVLTEEVKRAAIKIPTKRDIDRFNKHIAEAETSVFVVHLGLVEHRNSIEQRIARIMTRVSEIEMRISSGDIHSAASRNSEAF
ncbi:MAG: hypothetical protein K0S56_406 [Microvirga sp.]|jgi:hypothetical protein|nr:hypothetical protein [Microvirga sp.]